MAALLMSGGQTASAHTTIAEEQVTAGSYALLTFGVPHGCEGSPTTEVRIQIPEPIEAVTPTVNPNWDVEVIPETLDEPIADGHGGEITERASEVVYTADTPLPDHLRDAFVLSLRVPEETAGDTLYFPTIQTCEQGEAAWIEIPADGEDAHELDEPAPSIDVLAPQATSPGSAEPGSPDATATDDTDPDSGEADATADAGNGDEDSSGSDGAARGLAVVALALGAGGIGVGGAALSRQRRR